MKPTLSELLESLTSIRRIEDPTEVSEYLEGRWKHRNSPSFGIGKTSDGRCQVKKALGTIDTKSSIPLESMKALTAKRGIPWEEAYADRFIASWASDERVDAHGDIVIQNWDFTEFQDNPAMPFNHDWDGLAMGAHVDWKVANRTTTNYNGPALWMLSLHATAEQLEFADKVFRLRKAGFLRANSVGFAPGVVIQIQDEEERQKLGLGRYGEVLDDNLLIENSPTLLGANAGALSILNSAVAKKLIDKPTYETAREICRRQLLNSPDVWKEEDERFRQLGELVFNTRLAKHTDIEEPFDIEEAAFTNTVIVAVTDTKANSEVEEETEVEENIEVEETEVEETEVEEDIEAKAKSVVTKGIAQMEQLLIRQVQLGAALESLGIAILSRLDGLEELLLQSSNDEVTEVELVTTLVNGTTVTSRTEQFADTISDNEHPLLKAIAARSAKS